MTPKLKEAGIPDLKQKLLISRRLLNARSLSSFVEQVISPQKDDSENLVTNTIENLRKGSKPTKPESIKFWDRLAYGLNCPDGVKGVMLVEADLDEFIGHLPEDHRALAMGFVYKGGKANTGSDSTERQKSGDTRARGAAGVRQMRPLDLTDGRAVWLRTTGMVQTIATGFRARKIDQKQYYLDPDSATAWSTLVNTRDYPTYHQCENSLQALLATEQWHGVLDRSQPATALILAGGGAPTKDLLLLRSLLSKAYTEYLHYYLFDISFWMTKDSLEWIHKHSHNIDGFERVDLSGVYGDVLDMNEDFKTGLHRDGRVVFVITGGTIGNLSEAAFFRSLDRGADEGDILFIGAETTNGKLSEAEAKALRDKYDNPALRRFIRPVVKAVLGAAHSHEDEDNALSRIHVDLQPGIEVNASDVKESTSVIVTLDVDGREVTLATSNSVRAVRVDRVRSPIWVAGRVSGLVRTESALQAVSVYAE